MAEKSQENNNSAQETGVISEQVAEKVIVDIQQDQLNDNIPTRTEQMLLGLMDGSYLYENIKSGMADGEFSTEVKAGIYSLWGKEIIRLLDEAVAKKRIMSSRERYAAEQQARADSKSKGKKKLGKNKEEEEEEIKDESQSVQKMTLDEIGQELAAQEETEKSQREEREKQEEEMQEERKIHAQAYQFAFNMFSEAITISCSEDVSSLSGCVVKLGDENFGARQSAVDRIGTEPHLELAADALTAALKDKIIIHKVIQAIGKIGQFQAISTLLGIIRENSGSKESTIRGLAEQAIGEILKSMSAKQKGSGLKKFYLLIKKPSFEKNLSPLISILKRDVESIQMRKYYISKQCLKWLLVLANKLIVIKKKKVKVAFVTMSVKTPLTKEISEISKIIQDLLKAA